MGNRLLFCIIVVFALVFARANVFAQWSAATNDSLLRNNNVYSVLLNEGIDSILNSYQLSRFQTYIMFDSVINDRILKTVFQIAHLNNSKKISFSDHEGESGAYIVSASGRILPLSKSTIEFSFERSRKYFTKFENIPSDIHSFWDSTAKPILVTLGAIAVIALFFLVRG